MIWITRSLDLHSDNIITTTTTTSKLKSEFIKLQTAVNKELDNVMHSEAAIWTAMVTQQVIK